ncbi:hypothetical protein [Sinorhizobium sp. KGO-5]|uniref:hypothetical protein n=1 Tax=Sinorhizobium sp. KGO-5 TaxID=1470810 RepID=UPI0030C670E3
MPGLENGNVFSAASVMARGARLGKRVLLLDETGGWKGCGTAWKLAEQGHQVLFVTPDALVAKELQRTSADVPLRKKLGVVFFTETSIDGWQGDGAVLIPIWRESRKGSRLTAWSSRRRNGRQLARRRTGRPEHRIRRN